MNRQATYYLEQQYTPPQATKPDYKYEQLIQQPSFTNGYQNEGQKTPYRDQPINLQAISPITRPYQAQLSVPTNNGIVYRNTGYNPLAVQFGNPTVYNNMGPPTSQTTPTSIQGTSYNRYTPSLTQTNTYTYDNNTDTTSRRNIYNPLSVEYHQTPHTTYPQYSTNRPPSNTNPPTQYIHNTQYTQHNNPLQREVIFDNNNNRYENRLQY